MFSILPTWHPYFLMVSEACCFQVYAIIIIPTNFYEFNILKRRETPTDSFSILHALSTLIIFEKLKINQT